MSRKATCRETVEGARRLKELESDPGAGQQNDPDEPASHSPSVVPVIA